MVHWHSVQREHDTSPGRSGKFPIINARARLTKAPHVMGRARGAWLGTHSLPGTGELVDQYSRALSYIWTGGSAHELVIGSLHMNELMLGQQPSAILARTL